MSDPNIGDFYKRVARIERARKKGFGLEASGTLGRSHYAPTAPRRSSILGPVLFVLLCGFLLKGVIYSQVGPELYNQRVAALLAGDGIDRVGGWLMQADPVTLYASKRISNLLISLQ